MNYSKGSWKISEEYTGGNHIAIEIGMPGMILIERHVSLKDDQDIHNAQLISAAPEMFECLKQIEALAENEQWAKSLLRQYPMFKEAILKAEGKI